MSDAMRIGTSALLAYQRSLSTISHNVANAGVDGYSRQRVELTAQVGGGVFGAGVNISGINRLSDVYANSRLIDDGAGLAQQQRLADVSIRVDQLLSDPTSGLASALNDFFAAARDVEADPTNLSAREVLLSSAEVLAARTQGLDNALTRLEMEIDQRATAAVGDANGLIDRIARLNRDLTLSGAATNDLLDQRDAAVRELSQLVGVRTALQDGNVLNVYTSDGHALVLGGSTQKLSLQADPADVRRQQLRVGSGAGAVAISSPVGGELGGLFAARAQVIDPARAGVGAVAGSVAQAVNLQQRLGTDLLGSAGAELFALGTPKAMAHSANTGTVEVSLSFASGEPVSAQQYQLRFTAGDWVLRDTRSGENVPLGGSGTVADPFTAAGFEIVVDGVPQENDRFAIAPGSDAMANLRTLTLEARQIAAAGALQAEAANSNTGTVTAGPVLITDPDDPLARQPASITFLTADTVSINGGAAQAVAADGSISGPGWVLQTGGAAAAGDLISISPTGAGSRDNANAAGLAGLSSGAVTASGQSPAAAYADTVAASGARTRQAESSRDAFERMQSQNMAARESVSGVNLDEEAANLIRLQQAYQAAAQVISMADNLFQTLIGAVRR